MDMSWSDMKWRFRVKNNGVIRASWQDNESWMDIHLEGN